MSCSGNVGNKKYVQNFGRLKITSEYSLKTRDNTKICFEAVRCEITDRIEVDQLGIWRWRRVNKSNNWFSLIVCIGSV